MTIELTGAYAVHPQNNTKGNDTKNDDSIQP